MQSSKELVQGTLLFIFVAFLALPPVACIYSDFTPPQEKQSASIPIREIKRPTWVTEPTNQTIEYGTRFKYKLSISSSEEDIEWRISDTYHFRIGSGLIQDNFILSIGAYYVGVQVWDNYYDQLTSWFWVFVVDSVYPELLSPGNIEFDEGEENKTLKWTVYDLNPQWYQISLGGQVFDEGIWSEELQVFEINLSRLKAGTYVYTLTVTDLGDNISEDSVVAHIHKNDSISQSTTASVYTHENNWENRNRDVQIQIYAPMETFAVIVISGLIGLISVAFLMGGPKGFQFE